ncbi:hypothetical protein [Butyrivibrio sp. FC2001]|uniref:hypothetical protein n=1 Tax=Butyrivibrio sp. FC2001 TaxID=1280671 RepID=UPI0003FC601F|nr:hypothetical protein [Butyrivibrio sp. FC2001]
MSDLIMTLAKRKEELLANKQMLEESVIKYSLPGYINKKNIRGKETYYLQFKDRYYRMTSVYLSKEKLLLCQYAFDKRAELETALKGIDEDLKLLQNIPAEPWNRSENGKILDDVIGLSVRHKTLFQINYDDSQGKYIITYYGKKKKYEIPMLYVNENYHQRIAEYIQSASCIVDEAVDRMFSDEMKQGSDKQYHSFKAQTKTGIKYSYEEADMTYLLNFYYKKRKYTIEYEPYFINEERKDSLEISRMGFYVEKFLHELKFKEEVSRYRERKQNVHTETKKS